MCDRRYEQIPRKQSPYLLLGGERFVLKPPGPSCHCSSHGHMDLQVPRSCRWADVGWMAKTCIDLCSNLISTKVSASHRKSMQDQARPGQTEAQVYFDNVMTKFIVINRTDA